MSPVETSMGFSPWSRQFLVSFQYSQLTTHASPETSQQGGAQMLWPIGLGMHLSRGDHHRKDADPESAAPQFRATGPVRLTPSVTVRGKDRVPPHRLNNDSPGVSSPCGVLFLGNMRCSPHPRDGPSVPRLGVTTTSKRHGCLLPRLWLHGPSVSISLSFYLDCSIQYAKIYWTKNPRRLAVPP